MLRAPSRGSLVFSTPSRVPHASITRGPEHQAVQREPREGAAPEERRAARAARPRPRPASTTASTRTGLAPPAPRRPAPRAPPRRGWRGSRAGRRSAPPRRRQAEHQRRAMVVPERETPGQERQGLEQPDHSASRDSPRTLAPRLAPGARRRASSPTSRTAVPQEPSAAARALSNSALHLRPHERGRRRPPAWWRATRGARLAQLAAQRARATSARVAAVDHEHRPQRAEVQRDVDAEGRLVEPERGLREDQVAVGADGQELGDPLDHGQDAETTASGSEPSAARVTPAGSPRPSGGGTYSSPKASATPLYVILPSTTLAAVASGSLSRMARAAPRRASCSVYGSVALVSAKVLVCGTAPGMLATQ